MNAFIWLIVGASVGWIACAALNMNVTRGLVISAVIGVAGALLGGHVLAPAFGAQSLPAGEFSMSAMLFAAGTAAVVVKLADTLYERFGF